MCDFFSFHISGLEKIDLILFIVQRFKMPLKLQVYKSFVFIFVFTVKFFFFFVYLINIDILMFTILVIECSIHDFRDDRHAPPNKKKKDDKDDDDDEDLNDANYDEVICIPFHLFPLHLTLFFCFFFFQIQITTVAT